MKRICYAKLFTRIFQIAFAVLFTLGSLTISELKPYYRQEEGEKTKVAVEKYGSEYWLVLPPKYDEKKTYPLLITLHGWGGKNWLSPWEKPCAEYDFILASPKSINKEGKWNAWHKKSDFEKDGEYLKYVVDEICKKHKVNDKKIYMAGFSGGGFAAGSFGLAYHKLFGAIIVGGAGIQKVEGEVDFSNAKGKLFFLGVGEKDQHITFTSKSKKELEKNGALVTYRVFKKLGHTWPANESSRILQWLKKFGDIVDAEQNYENALKDAKDNEEKIKTTKADFKKWLSEFDIAIKSSKGKELEEYTQSLDALKKSLLQKLETKKQY